MSTEEETAETPKGEETEETPKEEESTATFEPVVSYWLGGKLVSRRFYVGISTRMQI